MASLPTEVQSLIIMALNTSNNPDETISAIMATSQTNKALNKIVKEVYYDNLKGFTALVHMIAAKFNTTVGEVVQKFKTPTSDQYNKLRGELYKALASNDIAKAKQAIEQGADVNYFGGSDTSRPESRLYDFVQENNLNAVKLLLAAGANPNYNAKIYSMIMEQSNNIIQPDLEMAMNPIRTAEYIETAKAIRKLIEDAVQNSNNNFLS